MEVKIKLFEEGCMPIKSDKGDWYDLFAREDVFVPYTHEATLIPLGVAMELPKGYEAHVVPRSSTFKTWGIIQTNHMGVIDEKYCGDDDQWMMPVYCLVPKDMHNGMRGTMIRKGDKICQFRIMEHQPSFTFNKVDVLGNENRGGIGSTGTK